MLFRAGSKAARIALLALCIAACRQDRQPPGEHASPAPPPVTEAAEPETEGSEEEICDDPVPIYRDGEAIDHVCETAAADMGLTVVDLSDTWAPRVLGGGGSLGPVPYRERFLRIAREDFGEDETWWRARHDRYHELYGVPPTPALVGRRLLDEERHACHDAVSREALEALERGIDTWRTLPEQRGDHAWRKSLHTKMELAAKQLEVEHMDELGDHPQLGPLYLQYKDLSIRIAAIADAQAHFVCEGLLESPVKREGFLDTATIEALQAYLRRHMIITWQLDAESKQILLSDSRELDFRQLLRSLRERVVDATGLIEDGTAIGKPGEVVDRIIDTDTLIGEHDGVVLEGGAPDMVAAATDAAARHLGWTSPGAAMAFFSDDPVPSRAALPLPDMPDYHSARMDLRVVIDRGDVWYDFPFVSNGNRRYQQRDVMPTLVLYAGDTPLVRWPTTIGGWQPENLGGNNVKLVYKESPPGARIYRDIVAAPRWVPPRSTPTRDLLRPKGHGRWAPRFDTFGPSYASAYGMVMMIHHRIDEKLDGTQLFTDQGIRTHGSVSYASIMDGFSHGCHRLHNHRAVRLSGFFLAHRSYEVRGPIELDFHRTLFWRKRRYPLHFASRGFRYELTPPIDIDVTTGNVRGYAGRPQTPRGLTRPMLKRYR